MIHLRDYDGTDSTRVGDDDIRLPEGPGFSTMGSLGSEIYLWGVVLACFRPLTRALGRARRRRMTLRLRAEIIPDWPDSLICPLCWEVTRRRP